MGRVHIAIIDDGVNEKYYNDLNIAFNLTVNQELAVEERKNYNSYASSHGTVCAAIIRKYCKSAMLSSIKIIDDDKRGNKYKLIKAIEWCINNNINVINLSIGTVNRSDKKELKNIVDRANQKGIVIVAANKNEDIITYPAFFYNVIGVKCDVQNMLSEGQFQYNFAPEDQIELTACGSYTLVNYLGIVKKEKNCNSFAAPLITAVVANFLSKASKMPIYEVKKRLWKQSINYSQEFRYCEYYNNLEWIQKALVFKIGSEVQLENDKSVFGIEKVINIKASGTEELLIQIGENLESSKDVLDSIDSIILDINDAFISHSNNTLEEIIKNVHYYNKNIALLSDLNSDENIMKKLAKYSMRTYLSPVNNAYSNQMLQTGNKKEPMILLINLCEQSLISLFIKLDECFKQEDYNTTIFSNDIYGVYYGFRYFTINKKSPLKVNKELINTLNYSVALNNSDIGILGVSIKQSSMNFERLFNELEDIDICILIDQSCTSFIYKSDIEELEISRDCNYMLADFSSKAYAEFLYKKVMSIFRD